MPSPSSRNRDWRCNRRAFLAGAGGLGVVALAGCLGRTRSGGQAGDDFPEGVRFDVDWPSYAHDDANTAFLREGRAVSEPVVEYEIDFDRWTGANTHPDVPPREPTVSGDVLFMAGNPVWAVDYTTKELKWARSATGQLPPTVLDDTAYATTYGPNAKDISGVRAQTGETFWSASLPDFPTTSPAFSNDRKTMFVGLRDEQLCAVDVDSADVLWTRDLFGEVVGPLAINLGQVFAVTSGQKLYSLAEDGTGIWEAALETIGPVAPVVGEERVYVAGRDRIAAFDRKTGRLVWEDDTGVRYRLAFDGERIYASNGNLRVLDAETGEQQWKYSIESGTVSAAAVVDDTVYVGTSKGELAALDRTGGGLFDEQKRWSLSLGTYVGNSLASTDRRVFCPVMRDGAGVGLTVVADSAIETPE
ncbi:PQQ-binding-like beta-propeller repeat protein [Haloferax sp. DFSO60]|uniref:PQQ-binding-like beta-propeller repeat protein n=1 Tax=Haloferax sp. DFSO60 TaxID=3388652 RepID=UPI003978876D